MSSDSGHTDHTDNPYASVCKDFDTITRPFLDAYLPALVSVASFTWEADGSLTPAYLLQCVVLVSHQFDSPDTRTDMRALAWELSDHVRVSNGISPIRQPVMPERSERCGCGMDHHLEANALAAFLERSLAGDNRAAVRVLDALWRDMNATDPVDVIHVGASLLGHVVGGMIYAHLHRDCDEEV